MLKLLHLGVVPASASRRLALVLVAGFIVLVRMYAVAQESVKELPRASEPWVFQTMDLDTAAFARVALTDAGSHRLEWYDPITSLPGDWATAGGMVIQEKSLPALFTVGAATSVLLLTDRMTFHTSRTFYRNHAFVRNMSDVFVRLGEGTTHLGIAAGFGLYGLLGKDERSLRTGSEIVEALLATGITVQLLKRMSGRESPQMVANGSSRWRPFPSLAGYQKNQPKYYSFPSGHIATAMATLTVIADNYPEQRWIRPVGYGVIGALGISLVNVRYHWFSDLPLGLLLGYTFGQIATHHNDAGNAEASSHRHVILKPMLEHDGAGVTLALVY